MNGFLRAGDRRAIKKLSSPYSPRAGIRRSNFDATTVGEGRLGPDLGDSLERQVKRGLGWSVANTLTLRMASLLLGIILARVLTPSAFGVYAVALTVQSILMTLADLGLSTDLVRSANHERKEPTVASLGLLAGSLLAVLMCLTASSVAGALRAPAAGPVIMVLSITMVFSGAGVVPYAKLVREFQQKKLFVTSAADFVVSSAVTLTLVMLGLGPISIAIGRLIAQATATALQFFLTSLKPRFGFDRAVAGPALRYGLPLAGANLLSWLLLSIDNIIISKVAGSVALGLYVLAFNVSSWPMSAIGQAIRSVSLAGFAKVASSGPSDGEVKRKTTLEYASALAWSAAVPAGALLAVLATPLIRLVYGQHWILSAPVLAALGLFGGLRVLLDLWATYLTAQGATRPVLVIQVLWLAFLAPSMVFATHRFGILGAGWVHVVIGTFVIAPAYLYVLRLHGGRVLGILNAIWPPTLAGGLAWTCAYFVAQGIGTPLLALVAGGSSGLCVYVLVLHRWVMQLVRSRKAFDAVSTEESCTPAP